MLLIVHTSLAYAKLGFALSTFTEKLGTSFKLIGQEKKNQKVYYHYKVVTDDKINNASPGFGGGLTITSDNGKISGESLLVKLGNDREIGQRLAAVLCLNLAYEALAKPIPKDLKDQNAELDSYKHAVSDAALGKPGRISYPGFSSQLIFSMTNDGSLLFVISNPMPGQQH